MPVDPQPGCGCVAAPVEVALGKVAIAGEAAAALICGGGGRGGRVEVCVWGGGDGEGGGSRAGAVMLIIGSLDTFAGAMTCGCHGHMGVDVPVDPQTGFGCVVVLQHQLKLPFGRLLYVVDCSGTRLCVWRGGRDGNSSAGVVMMVTESQLHQWWVHDWLVILTVMIGSITIHTVYLAWQQNQV